MLKGRFVKIIFILAVVFTLLQINAIANLPPDIPTVKGRTRGRVGINYTFTIVSTDPECDNIGYGFCGKCGNMPCNTSLGLFESGEEITVKCRWDDPGDYVLKVCAIDCHGSCSDFAIVEIKMQKNYSIFDIFITQLISRFRNLKFLL